MLRLRANLSTAALLAAASLALLAGAGGLLAQSAGSPSEMKPSAAANSLLHVVPRIEAMPLPENRGAAALYESLKRLDTTASLMMITAHPDDEDGGMLTYESRALGVRTALMSLTRGEGGQNAMSAAQNDALGLIRTNELLRAGQYYGLDQQYWGTVADYGFSKTIEEALQQWGHERVLYDVVRAVRLYRPMVVCSVFVGGVTDGHGHHQVAGMMAQEVYNAAGDPKVFPDQIAAGLEPWTPLKVYARVPGFSLSPKGMYDYATGKYAPVRFRDYVNQRDIEGVPETNLTIDEGQRDPLLGQTYLQISRRGLGEQRSQHEGPNVPLAGEASSAYHRYGSRVRTEALEQNFFDGIDTSLPGLAALAGPGGDFLRAPLTQMQQLVTKALDSYAPEHPEQTAPLLAEIARHTTALLGQVRASGLDTVEKASVVRELEIKQRQANDALAQALGLEMTALVTPGDGGHGFDIFANGKKTLPLTPEETPQQVTPGAEFRVRVHLAMPEGVTVQRVSLEAPDGPERSNQHWTVERVSAPGLDEPASRGGDVLFHVTVARDAAPTAPYFSRPSIAQPYYDVADPLYRNFSFAPYPLNGVVDFAYQGVTVQLAQAVQTMHSEVGPGAVFAPLVVTPELSVSLGQQTLVEPLGARRDLTVTARLHATRHASGTLHLELPAGWHATPAAAEFHLKGGEDTSVPFLIHAPALKAEDYPITAVAESAGHRFTAGYEIAGYGALIPYNLYRPAHTELRGIDVAVPKGRRIGYVMGTGDTLPSAIEELGLHPDVLSATDLSTGDLSLYQTIVLGIRAYSARPELPLVNGRLLAWVHDGGTLVVMYQGPEFDHGYAPYAMRLNQSGIPERVVDEHAPVVLLNPADPLLTTPNRITQADFTNWVEERGHSFMSSWAKEYAAPTETHDPGQDQQRGGLLHAAYGKGEYIYVAYALHRQTPEGVPGAFRLLANLLSAGGGAPPQPSR